MSELEPALRTGSLRRRVLVAVLGLLLAVIVTICAAVNIILSNRLYSDARHQIAERAQYATVLGQRGLTPQELADGLTGQGITASVLRDGEVTVGRDAPPPGGPGRPGGRPGQAGPGPVARSGHTAVTVRQDARQLSVELTVPGGQLRLTYSLAEIHRTLALLHRVELAVAAATLLIGGLVLVLVVGAALAPLRRMRLLADRIRAGLRGVRLRPTRPGTDLGRTALAIDDMLEALEAAETDARSAELRMRQLLADVSHDLRTPIAGVITSAEHLLRTDPSRAAREQRLVELIREGRRAARLVDDLLLMTRLDVDAPSAGVPVAVDVAAVAGEVVGAARRRLADRRVDFDVRVDQPLLAWIDPDHLARLLTNLLDNAREATEPGGRLAITVTARPGRVVVRVADDGPGVPPGERERIFDRLVRLDPSRRAGGTGLGLPIARALARAAGGDLRLVPDGPGACFEVELPVVPAAAQLSPPGELLAVE
ncbi:HAMP domain-containing sensor histidine kinase [Jatrophihabitans sp.]|uniref:sensor histidine kinase n=1 Tax=Jatrophihabitans sp. TaxID=1932789 RepID=UPI0030C71718